MARTILSISRDQILLETRAAILRRTGHRVLSVSNIEDFADLMRDTKIDLVVLGHTLPAHDREDAYQCIEELKCNCPVIELYATAVAPKSPAHFHLAVHDRTFQADLLTLVQQVLSDSTN